MCPIPSSTLTPAGGDGARDGAIASAVGVLTVDDNALYRRVIARVVASTPGFDCVGEATSGEDAVALAATLAAELVLMDVRMPGIGGIEAARRIIEQSQGRVAVVLMSSDPRLLAAETLPPGTAGTLRKERLSPSELCALWAG